MGDVLVVHDRILPTHSMSGMEPWKRSLPWRRRHRVPLLSLQGRLPRTRWIRLAENLPSRASSESSIIELLPLKDPPSYGENRHLLYPRCRAVSLATLFPFVQPAHPFDQSARSMGIYLSTRRMILDHMAAHMMRDQSLRLPKAVPSRELQVLLR
jgi:hypothetical protein